MTAGLFGVLLLAASERASAADTEAPSATLTTDQCLDASEASLSFENENKPRSARDESRACAAATCPAEIREECQRRLVQLRSAIPSVLFDIKDASGKPVTSARLFVDGAPSLPWVAGTAVEFDPGEHRVDVEVPGFPRATHRLTLRLGEQNRRESISLPLVASGAHKAPEPPTANSSLPNQRVAALAVGAAGLVSVGVGSVFGSMAIHRNNEVKRDCDANYCDDPRDTERSKSAVSLANVSTLTFILGGVALGGAAVLWFTAPSPASTQSIRLGVGVGHLQISGAF